MPKFKYDILSDFQTICEMKKGDLDVYFHILMHLIKVKKQNLQPYLPGVDIYGSTEHLGDFSSSIMINLSQKLWKKVKKGRKEDLMKSRSVLYTTVDLLIIKNRERLAFKEGEETAALETESIR